MSALELLPRDAAEWQARDDASVTAVGRIHRVTEVRHWVNPHRVAFIDWRSACGAADTTTSGGITEHGARYRLARRMACRDCWGSR